MTAPSITLTATQAFAQLQAYGYPRRYIERLLPEWWDASLLRTSSGVLQFAMILKQRLGLDVSFADTGVMGIQPATVRARFKHRVDTAEGELAIAASMGLALAELTDLGMRERFTPLPADPVALRELIVRESGRHAVDFAGLLAVTWQHGIPVIFLDDLPTRCKRLTGMAASLDDRPVIVLGLKHQQRARQLFVLAHELAHILCGHVGPGTVLIDEDIADVTDAMFAGAVPHDAEEMQADRFALQLLRNGQDEGSFALGDPRTPSTLAVAATRRGEALGIDPGHLVLSFAKATRNWATASQALDFFPDAGHALRVIREAFFHHVDLDRLSVENREYLIAAQGFAG
jgi:hypothetical protein